MFPHTILIIMYNYIFTCFYSNTYLHIWNTCVVCDTTYNVIATHDKKAGSANTVSNIVYDKCCNTYCDIITNQLYNTTARMKRAFQAYTAKDPNNKNLQMLMK